MSAPRDRLLFPAAGLWRSDLARYYQHVSQPLVAACAGRAVTIIRYPHGIGQPGFFQKYVDDGGRRSAIRIEEPADLLRWVQQGAIEFHLPLAAGGGPAPHDWAVMDLDPHPPAGWSRVVDAAQAVSRLFEHVGLPMSVKTSGGRGVHILVPIVPTAAADAAEAMERLARVACAVSPDVMTVVRRVRDRGPRVYLDYLQNSGRRTMAAVYGVRAREPAPVSWPTSVAALAHQPADEHRVAAVLRQPRVPAWTRGTPVELGAALKRAGIPTVQELRKWAPPGALRESDREREGSGASGRTRGPVE